MRLTSTLVVVIDSSDVTRTADSVRSLGTCSSLHDETKYVILFLAELGDDVKKASILGCLG